MAKDDDDEPANDEDLEGLVATTLRVTVTHVSVDGLVLLCQATAWTSP